MTLAMIYKLKKQKMEELQDLIKFLKDKGLEHHKIDVDVLCGIIEYFASKQENKQCTISDVSNCALYNDINERMQVKEKIGEEKTFRKAVKLLREKYDKYKSKYNRCQVDCVVKLDNGAELLFSGVDEKMKLSIWYGDCKEVVIFEKDFDYSLVRPNTNELFKYVYAELMEFIDLWN